MKLSAQSKGIALDQNSKLGRFDQSFVVKMIRDFFLLLLLVSVLELGIRFGIVLYEFYQEEPKVTRLAAERLASDVKDIMVNSGGPVAARTLYPILRDNHEARGLVIAVEPNAATVASIEGIFKFTPKGIPAAWPEGRHHAYTVVIEADRFCLKCHTGIKVGEPLGSVTVRSYLSQNLGFWWREVRLTGVMSLFKVVLATVLLFFLLRVRLAPLLALRSVVAGLAKGASDLSFRAPVKSTDEFGELASDLNLFLDRLTHILDDLKAVLARVAALNQRLEIIHGKMMDGFEEIGSRLAVATRAAFVSKEYGPVLSPEWLKTARTTGDLLLKVIGDAPDKKEIAAGVETLFSQLEEVVIEAERLRSGIDATGKALVDVSGDVRAFSHFMGEMAILEEKMQAIAETGQSLVDRLIEADSKQ